MRGLKIKECLDEKTYKKMNKLRNDMRGQTSHISFSENEIKELMGHSSYKRVRGAIRQVRQN